MLTLICGGSRAGKSTWAEKLVASLPNAEKIYIAAMSPLPQYRESVARQQAARAAMGFTRTIEAHTDVAAAAGKVPSGAAVLLECLCHLTAGELFGPDGRADDPDAVIGRILAGVFALSDKCDLYVITNEVSADGETYDPDTELYRSVLSALNRECAKRADAVYEVVCGLPVKIK